ncbi:hypothetical protein MLD38_027485 [Melastoma candidum]|uniref:Uncharacterized protein n=1 Tax=Melastoma candidum TaxID=119954 RepID=A0ACB9P2Z0_9MYRT|nr:hypothetical protein MLD38_027485 [Melastoma candidum]
MTISKSIRALNLRIQRLPHRHCHNTGPLFLSFPPWKIHSPFLGWMIVNQWYGVAFAGLAISGATDWMDMLLGGCETLSPNPRVKVSKRSSTGTSKPSNISKLACSFYYSGL